MYHSPINPETMEIIPEPSMDFLTLAYSPTKKLPTESTNTVSGLLIATAVRAPISVSGLVSPVPAKRSTIPVAWSTCER